jgi:ATP-dependent exoDNAse (exonuclease V) beta subunit
VHGALAAIDLSTGTDDAGRPADDVARAQALAHGVGDHSPVVAALVAVARRSPAVAAGAGRPHWRQVAVTVPAGRGVFEGHVDLVVEDDGGLVVVDYRTERAEGRAALAAAAVRYGPEVASYAVALEAATGRHVHRCVLVFVGGDEPVEHVLEGAALASASRQALDAMAALTSAP